MNRFLFLLPVLFLAGCATTEDSANKPKPPPPPPGGDLSLQPWSRPEKGWEGGGGMFGMPQSH